MKKGLLFLFVILPFYSFSQNKRSAFADTLKSVNIDSVLVITAKRGLAASDFIEVMMSDTAFYRAFQEMRFHSFVAENKIITYQENNKIEGKILRTIYHNNTGPKYKQEVLVKIDSGKIFKKNGEFDLYTVKMFSYIFMNEHNSDFIPKYTKPNLKEKGDEGYKQKLKTLLFTPGKPITGVPLISDKTEIFSPELQKYYDNSFYYATYQNNIPVYYFKSKVKKGISWWKEGDTMIKELTTIFDAKNMNILGRYIELAYFSVPFDFNVKMNIELSYIKDDILVPTYISYDGEWDIPFKKKEICTFEIKHTAYK